MNVKYYENRICLVEAEDGNGLSPEQADQICREAEGRGVKVIHVWCGGAFIEAYRLNADGRWHS